MTSKIKDWAERREAECAELSDIYDSAGSVEEFMLNVDQLLPECPRALVRVFLMNKWLERHPRTFIVTIVGGIALLWGGALMLMRIFLSTGHNVLALLMLCLVLGMLYIGRRSVSPKATCWRLGDKDKR